MYWLAASLVEDEEGQFTIAERRLASQTDLDWNRIQAVVERLDVTRKSFDFRL